MRRTDPKHAHAAKLIHTEQHLAGQNKNYEAKKHTERSAGDDTGRRGEVVLRAHSRHGGREYVCRRVGRVRPGQAPNIRVAAGQRPLCRDLRTNMDTHQNLPINHSYGTKQTHNASKGFSKEQHSTAYYIIVQYSSAVPAGSVRGRCPPSRTGSADGRCCGLRPR